MDSPRRCRIALVEHDAMIARSILATLRSAGHVCRRFETGTGALREIDRDQFDLILIERTLPDIASLDLMTGMRARLGYSLPVIGLASDTEGVVAALDEGVDDCLSRPLPPRLLLAQINAAIRRVPPQAGRVEAVLGHLAFQSDRLSVRVGDTAVPLTAKEYKLALLLCRRSGQALAREDILRTIWGDEVAPLTRTLDVHVSRLRTKLELRPELGFTLSALYGRGYRLDYDPAIGAAAPPPAARPALSPRRSALPSAPLANVRRRPRR
ncbi:response regulator transcription factor [Sphingomonas solaris]|uniref:Response regulator transcription factor n=1 Tax=Alterirhizorhabdus solaris TaxID=2529389 RepID=A0A558QXR3_9SPHN|nr:response regulator transcription factor [Sphingomonas solaris]TVV71852.1 response regulator transcription factor [Sphingomonas solaris]